MEIYLPSIFLDEFIPRNIYDSHVTRHTMRDIVDTFSNPKSKIPSDSQSKIKKKKNFKIN